MLGCTVPDVTLFVVKQYTSLVLDTLHKPLHHCVIV